MAISKSQFDCAILLCQQLGVDGLRHVLPTNMPSHKPKTRSTINITYNNKHFPPLSHNKSTSKPKASSIQQHHTSASTSTTSSVPTPITTMKERLDKLEQQVQEQQTQLTKLQTIIKEQSDSFQQLTKMIEDQAATTATLTDNIRTLTQSFATMEQMMHQILQFHKKSPPSPDHEQPLKRSRLRYGEISPAHLDRSLPDDYLHANTQWEHSDPNMSESNSIVSSPSL